MSNSASESGVKGGSLSISLPTVSSDLCPSGPSSREVRPGDTESVGLTGLFSTRSTTGDWSCSDVECVETPRRYPPASDAERPPDSPPPVRLFPRGSEWENVVYRCETSVPETELSSRPYERSPPKKRRRRVRRRPTPEPSSTGGFVACPETTAAFTQRASIHMTTIPPAQLAHFRTFTANALTALEVLVLLLFLVFMVLVVLVGVLR